MKKILLIEDDVIIRESTAELLNFVEDYNVITASNGVFGIQKALNELPDIIICDVMMPSIDGYGVLEKLSKNSKTKLIPFIFLSAKTERSDVRKGMNLGADDYITKPFTEEELITAIESRLAKSSILKELTSTSLLKELNYPEENIQKTEKDIKTLDDLKIFFDDNGTCSYHNEGDEIYKEGSKSNYVFLVKKGAVKCYKLNEQGKTLTTSIYKENDLFGYTSFSKNQPYQETAVTISQTELVGVKKSELINVLNNNHKVVLDLVDLLNDNLEDVKEQLLDMAYSSVHKKTAVTLLKFAEKINQKPNDLIQISRHDLANVAGISTETLIRSISKLRKEGIVDIVGRNIRILDLNALKEVE